MAEAKTKLCQYIFDLDVICSHSSKDKKVDAIAVLKKSV